MNIIENINRLEDYLINESEISLIDIQKISTYLTNIREEAIDYTRCCKSDSEQLHTEVFKLANKLAINDYGNEAVKMHEICNGM